MAWWWSCPQLLVQTLATCYEIRIHGSFAIPQKSGSQRRLAVLCLWVVRSCLVVGNLGDSFEMLWASWRSRSHFSSCGAQTETSRWTEVIWLCVKKVHTQGFNQKNTQSLDSGCVHKDPQSSPSWAKVSYKAVLASFLCDSMYPMVQIQL